ncbi:MAG: hypothetical protein HQ593_00250 [Candidatus Omnitrophica bacterium]|nr:hypothetical protein [Candidatus Omnitrophota bacterium]
MGKKEEGRRSDERVNQFIIECLFSKYFEEKGEIVSSRPTVGTRNDGVHVTQ